MHTCRSRKSRSASRRESSRFSSSSSSSQLPVGYAWSRRRSIAEQSLETKVHIQVLAVGGTEIDAIDDHEVLRELEHVDETADPLVRPLDREGHSHFRGARERGPPA